jgi:hypothetical protein
MSAVEIAKGHQLAKSKRDHGVWKGTSTIEPSCPDFEGRGDEPPDVDPIIAGLLKRLPKSGDVWPEGERKLWLQLLEGSFKLIYKDAPDESPIRRQDHT